MIGLMNSVYKEGGRVYPEFDCYGIVLAARRILGLPELPEYAEIRKGADMHSATMESLHMCEPCEPKAGAVALCWHLKMVRHIAVVIEVDSQLKVLEINPGKNATLSPVAAFERKYRRVRYYF